eukprot:440427-Karenia_brevis.AAC.1
MLKLSNLNEVGRDDAWNIFFCANEVFSGLGRATCHYSYSAVGVRGAGASRGGTSYQIPNALNKWYGSPTALT